MCHPMCYVFGVLQCLEEAIYNTFCVATTTSSLQGRTVEELPLDWLAALVQSRGR
jgi:hypothetical protein